MIKIFLVADWQHGPRKRCKNGWRKTKRNPRVCVTVSRREWFLGISKMLTQNPQLDGCAAFFLERNGVRLGVVMKF